MMAEKLDDGLKQLENAAADLQIEQNNEQAESSENQELRQKVQQNKDENMLKFEKIQGDLEAVNIKNSQLELKMSEMLKNMEYLCKVTKLQNGQEDNINKCKEVVQGDQDDLQIVQHPIEKQLMEKNTKCLHQQFEISKLKLQTQQLLSDLKGQEDLHLQEENRHRKELEDKDNICHQLQHELSQARKNPEFVLMRQQLLEHLKDQEELNLREVNGLRKELEDKDNICHQLQHELSQARKNPEFVLMRQQLLEHLKDQEELHLREVNGLRKELEDKDNICHQLEHEVSQVRENPEFVLMRQQLLEDLKDQEELHLRELNGLRKELEDKDNICHQLEHEVSQVRENPEFVLMRQQLLEDLKDQEELHLREVDGLRKELEDKDQMCLKREQEVEQLRELHEFSVSCSICMDPWNSSDHRLVALSCGHLFGEPCIRQCLQRNLFCPECRANASTNDIRFIYTRSP